MGSQTRGQNPLEARPELRRPALRPETRFDVERERDATLRPVLLRALTLRPPTLRPVLLRAPTLRPVLLRATDLLALLRDGFRTPHDQLRTAE